MSHWTYFEGKKIVVLYKKSLYKHKIILKSVHDPKDTKFFKILILANTSSQNTQHGINQK